MEILVCIKRVPLSGAKFSLTADGRDIDTSRLGFTVSPHEECAVEVAVRLVEQHGGSTTVLSLGVEDAEEQIRDALAVGIDEGILLVTDGEEWDAQATAGAIVDAIAESGKSFDLILFGNESADASGNQVGIRVAHALSRPTLSGLKGVQVSDGVLVGERPAGSVREVFEVSLPAVATVKDGAAIPRYPSVPGRIRAKKKPVHRSTPTRPLSLLAKQSVSVPESVGKQTKILGSGPEGISALVDVFRSIGVI
ncbi:MAG: electron transfer flavoprotein subunit beta/FixA family protein [Actinomycetes bacterium]